MADVIFSEKGYQIIQKGNMYYVLSPGMSESAARVMSKTNSFYNPDNARKFIKEQMKKDGVYGTGSFGNAFSNGRLKAMNAIAEKLKNVGIVNAVSLAGAASINKVASKIEAAKSKLKSSPMKENFGQDVVRKLKDEFQYNDLKYSNNPTDRQAASLLDSFDDWCSLYEGR